MGYYGRANAATTSATLASTTGSTVATMVSRMLLNSDNEIAEALHKLVGRKLGYGATWTGARTAQAKQLAAQSLSATGPVRRLRPLAGRPAHRDPAHEGRRPRPRHPVPRPTLADAVRPGHPHRGADRDPEVPLHDDRSRSARSARCGRRPAPSSDVVSLAGFTKGTDGRVKVFAFVVNGKDSTTTLKQNIDMLAATVNGCY